MDFPHSKKLTKELYDTINDIVFAKEIGIYTAYLYYSKYDHFGIMSYDLTIRDPCKRREKLIKCIKIFPKVLCRSLYILKKACPNNIDLESQYERVRTAISGCSEGQAEV